MIDFLMISTRSKKNGLIEIYPKFIIKKSSDLMIRGGDFYAIWIEERGLWSTDEQDALQLIDRELDRYAEENRNRFDSNIKVLHMWDSESGMIDSWHKYCQKQMRDSFHMLDEKLIFSNTPTNKKDYASKRLGYPLEAGETPAYDKLMSTLYEEEERRKIEWAIGSIISGESKKLQKFMVLYGAAGTGKSTVLNIIQQLFEGYYSVFDAKALGSSSNAFALEAFKDNPLVAIQHDGDLSKIEDNTRLNSLVSHERMTVNEKFKSTYSNSFKCFLFMGTNKPVKITDAKSGLIRRLIDVSPSGEKLSPKEYKHAVKQVGFELGPIAHHCQEVYLSEPGRYDDYIPITMLGASNDFYNFVVDSYHIFKKEDGTTLKSAWEMYKTYCDDAKVAYPFSQRVFKEELKNYFKEYKERFNLDDGTRLRSYYSGFRTEKFEDKTVSAKEEDTNPKIWFDSTESLFDQVCADCPAQYATSKETPSKKWDEVTTKLSELDTSKIHYVKIPENHIVIDFDIPGKNGEKSFEKNLEEAKSLQDLQESGNVRNTAGAAFAPITAGSKELADAAGDVNKFSKEVDVLTTKIASIDETTKRLEDSINISDLLFDPTKTPEKDKEVKYLDSYLQQKAIKKSEQDILDTITQSQLNAQKMVADLMQDGNVKELAQINANYDAKVAEIQKRERELLQTLQDAEYEQWKQANPDYQKKGLRFIPTVTELPQDKRTELDTEYSAAYQLQQNATAKLLSNTLAKYRDFAAQRTAIEKQMNDDISFLRSQRTESNTEEIDRAIQVAKDKAKESIQAVIDEENKALANQDNDFLRMLFGDVSQMAFSDLSELLKQARQLRSYLSGKGDKEGITFISPEQLKAIEESPEELDKLKKALDKLLEAGKKQNKWDSIFETFKKGFADLKSAQGFKEISGSIGMISGTAGQAAREIATMFEAMGKDSAANVIGSLGEVLNSISNIGQAFVTGGTVAGAFAAVGEIFSLIGKGAQETAKHRQVLENVMNDTIAQQREYNLLLLEQNLLYEKASTIFGVDSYAKAENAVRVLKDAISDLNGVLEGDTEQQKKFAYRKTGSAALDKVLNRNYSQSKDRYSGLADIEIKTGSYTTGALFWKKPHDFNS